MAKSKKRSRSSTKAVVVRAPSAKPIIIRQPAAVVSRRSSPRRRHGGGGGNAVTQLLSNERTAALGGAAILGLLDKQGTALPTIPFLGRAGTVGIGLYLWGRSNRSTQLAHAATGVLSIAVYELMKDGKIAGIDTV